MAKAFVSVSIAIHKTYHQFTINFIFPLLFLISILTQTFKTIIQFLIHWRVSVEKEEKKNERKEVIISSQNIGLNFGAKKDAIFT